MNESKQKRVLLIIIAILFLANTVTLVMLFMHKPAHKKDERNSRKNTMVVTYLKKDLGFNDAQLASFDSLHKKHMESVEEMFNEMRLEKEKRLKYLEEQGFSDSTIAIAGNTMAEKQKALEIKMLRHLREVRSIGTTAQQAKFDTTFIKFMNREKEKKKKKNKL